MSNWMAYSVGDKAKIVGTDLVGTIVEVDENSMIYKVEIDGTICNYDEDEVE